MLQLEDVVVGLELPPLRKGPVTRQRLVEWCAAENDYFSLHYDERVAERMKMPGTPIQGTYRYALMGQLVQGWMGPRATLRRISATYRGLALEGEVLIGRGRVLAIEKTLDATEVRLAVWVENDAGIKVAEGEALLQVS